MVDGREKHAASRSPSLSITVSTALTSPYPAAVTTDAPAPAVDVPLWPAPLRALVTGEQVLLASAEPLPDGPLRLVPVGGQRTELVKPAYRRWTDAAGATGAAEVVERWTLTAAADVEAA